MNLPTIATPPPDPSKSHVAGVQSQLRHTAALGGQRLNQRNPEGFHKEKTMFDEQKWCSQLYKKMRI